MKWDINENNHLPLRDELIDAVSKIIQFELPKDYIECVKQFHGGQPKNNSLTINIGGSPWGIGFGALLTLDPLESNENVIGALSSLRKYHGVENYYLPIVVGGAGDYLCFDYSKSQNNPTIVFWFHELEGTEAIFPVANSFTELLSMLKPNEE